MSDQYIGIYDNPNFKQGTTLGFSQKITEYVNNPELHEWLIDRGYQVTIEPATEYTLQEVDGHVWHVQTYVEPPLIDPPERRVASCHLYIEPPLRDEDVIPMAQMLGRLSSIDIGLGLCHLVDNRDIPVEDLTQWAGEVINSWR